MLRHRRRAERVLSLTAMVLPLLFCGCFERKEQIKISQQGSVTFQLSYRADSAEEMLTGDVMPSPQAGWATESKTEKDNEGKETFVLTALASFPPRMSLPSNYAVRSDTDADLYLQFPTHVTVEKRRDGMYYHFHRLYPARPSIEIEKLREKLLQDPLKEIGAEPKDWTPQQRVNIVKGLANFETEKMLVFARAAFQSTTPNGPQDGWLAVRDDLHQFIASMDYDTLAKLLEPKETQEEKDQTEKTITAESKRMETASMERLRSGLGNLASYDGSQLNAFMTDYLRRKKQFEITEDLNDDKFEISVELPGRIIASNADEISGATAIWKFDGERLHDVDLELMVTSRVIANR